MPTYSIHGPDGKTYSIDGPEGATREQVIAKIKEKQSAPPDVSTLGDVARSFGRGIAKGAIGLVGLPGDAAKLLNEGINKGEEAFGMTPPPSADVATSGQITKGVESVAGKFGEPQTTAGKYAQSVGEFVPSSFIGPGGIATKAATTIAGGLGAEAGGEIGGEWGRFFGGLIGGGAGGLASAETQAVVASGRLPTLEQIHDAAQAAYRQVENARLIASQGSLNGLVSSARAGLDQRLITDAVAPRTFRALQQLADSGGDVAQIMGVRQQLGKINPGAGTDYEAAQHVRDAIDHYIETLPPGEIVQGNPQFTQAMLEFARANWRAYAKLDQVQTALEIGQHRAAVSGTGANTQNAMRQRIREILDSERNSRGFSAETRQQMEDIVTGTWLQNMARFAGKFAPSGPISAMGSGLAYLGGGPGAAAAVAIPATIAKYLGTYLTRRQIQRLEDMIRAESPIGRPVARGNAAAAQNRAAILPAAAARSGLATSANSPLRIDIPLDPANVSPLAAGQQ
jgi:hypothetical protein